MRLSELKGRIEQILLEEGDMNVVRMQDIRLEDLSNAVKDSFVDYSSNDFFVVDHNILGKKFVIEPAKKILTWKITNRNTKRLWKTL